MLVILSCVRYNRVFILSSYHGQQEKLFVELLSMHPNYLPGIYVFIKLYCYNGLGKYKFYYYYLNGPLYTNFLSNRVFFSDISSKILLVRWEPKGPDKVRIHKIFKMSKKGRLRIVIFILMVILLVASEDVTTSISIKCCAFIETMYTIFVPLLW